jgi:hypothetical protein
MPLGRIRDPFSQPEWLFEVTWDGFRSLAYVHGGTCGLMSRNRNQFKSFPALADKLPDEIGARSAVLDSEFVSSVCHSFIFHAISTKTIQTKSMLCPISIVMEEYKRHPIIAIMTMGGTVALDTVLGCLLPRHF